MLLMLKNRAHDKVNSILKKTVVEMSSEAYQFQVAEMAGKRNKLDGLPPIIHRREDDYDPPESKFDLRKSLAWDTAFFTSPGILDHEELFETLNVGNLENGFNKPEHREDKSLISESLGPGRTSRVAECNARSSLAWDTAFFTSAGFLDPEELCMVNRGFKKSEAPRLPGIREEFWCSADSNSTIDSELSLASLEIDLFDHMKASLHKSSEKPDVSVSSSELGGGPATENFQSSRMMDASSGTRMEPVLPSRRQSVRIHGKEKMLKEPAIRPCLQAPVRNGEYNSSSSCKPSKTLNQAKPLSSSASKKASLGAKTEKVEYKIRKDASGKNMSKKPIIGDPGSGISLTPSPRSASSAGSDSAIQYHKRYSRLAVYDSKSRTPSRSVIGSRSNSVIPSQPVHLLATLNSSSTSPSSSIDGWSTASMNQLSENSKATLDAIIHRGDFLDSIATQVSYNGSHSCDQTPAGSKGKEVKLTNQHVDGLSKGTGVVPSTVSGSLKPSGLRMPLPKIGFFDMENPMALKPDGNPKFHTGLQTTSKIRSSMGNLDRTSDRGKCRKLQSARTSMRTGRMKMASPQAGASSFVPGIRPACPTDFQVKSGGYGSKTDCLQSDSKEEDEEINGIMENTRGGTESKGEAPQMLKKQDLKQNEDASTDCLENKPHMFCGNDKENICNFGNEVDNLSRHIEATDFSRDLVIEL